MDGAGKIAAGIVLAAVVLVVGFVGYREHERNRDQEEAAQFIQQLNDQGTAMVRQYQHADAVASARRAESSERARRARTLAAVHCRHGRFCQRIDVHPVHGRGRSSRRLLWSLPASVASAIQRRRAERCSA